ncbi:Acyl-CoA thioester hydrolase YbgC [Sinobacterium norvegicum]|uniref:Acyl-CoA thioester hydrolase YbgC n=1 Tax=Sinobacterium norvegicum TaxID=1641715 RepID=A0ABM9AF24_9GAMM|nr:tol-pal system-associated acyl-CoA thioesterase [Sinobacterium norvegicum]CAH0991626.1 Acyl-CoA thioester hydrolase YbgC [Sinobacterium norvegicum]
MSTFEFPIRVYIEDTDAGGIVYYVNYFKFMERARTEWMRSFGFGKTSIFAEDMMFVVHSVSADYKSPARLDDQLIATSRVIKSGAAYFTVEQQILCDGKLLCSGEAKIVCVDRETMTPRAIPKQIKDRVFV